MIGYLITLILGMIMGFIICKRFFMKTEELNTDECMEYLKNKGYYINLNLVQDKK